MEKEKTLKAGAIILSKLDKNKIALLYRSRENDWSFPKGHIDEGESVVQAMIREIQEETGLIVRIIEKLPDFNYTSFSGEIVSLKMFLVKSENDSLLKTEFEDDDIQWILIDKVIETLSYDNLKDYFKLIQRLILDIIVSL